MSQCLYCSKKLTQNATRQFNHLCECQAYLNHCATKGIQNNITRKVGIRAKPANQLPIHELSSKAKADLDLRTMCVCLVRGYLFTLFESEEMKSFCNGLNLAYKLPSWQRIAGDLLDAVYCDIQADITRLSCLATGWTLLRMKAATSTILESATSLFRPLPVQYTIFLRMWDRKS